MSYVNVMVIRNNQVYHFSVHYRIAQQLLNNNFLGFSGSPLENNPANLDAGYLVIDLDRQEVINRQHAFSSTQIKNKQLLWDNL